MEAAAKAGIPFYVLDRPNPITGTRVEGPMLDAANKSFVGYLAGVPVRHGMTMGELAQHVQRAKRKSAPNLTVIPYAGLESRRLVRFHRPPVDQSFAQYAQPEGGDAVSRRGHDRSTRRTTRLAAAPMRPSNRSARDFIGGRELAAYLNRRQIPGVRVYPTSFTPTESNFKGSAIERRALRDHQSRTCSMPRAWAWKWPRRSRSYIPAKSISR